MNAGAHHNKFITNMDTIEHSAICKCILSGHLDR